MFKLMTVDDSNIIHNKIERSTSSHQHFQVIARAHNGEIALERYKLYKPDIVTMDLTMPQVDGLECIQKIKSFDPNAKILVVSALSDKATAIRALKLGAKGFISKPFTEEDLLNALLRMVRR